MNGKRLVLAGVLALAGGVLAADGPANETINAKLLSLHRDEAKRWEIFVDPALKERAEFVSEPVFRWTNASRDSGQTGAMFVWTFKGRPVAMGGVFSNPARGRRLIMHELHAARAAPDLSSPGWFRPGMAPRDRRAFAPAPGRATTRGRTQAARAPGAGIGPEIYRPYGRRPGQSLAVAPVIPPALPVSDGRRRVDRGDGLRLRERRGDRSRNRPDVGGGGRRGERVVALQDCSLLDLKPLRPIPGQGNMDVAP